MSHTPSHQNSNNERQERRQNHKNEISRLAAAKKPLLDDAAAKFGKLANGFIAASKVQFVEGNRWRVFVGAKGKFFPVYKIGGKFTCDCADDLRYGFCAHGKAVEIAAAKRDAESAKNRLEDEKPYRAELRYGNRKRLNFSKSERFATKREACEWLARESFNKFQPEGEVTDVFGSVVFEISDEFFDLWADV